MNKNLLAFLAFVVAALFFGVLLFGGSLSGVSLQDAGFFSIALGLALMVVPA